MKNPVFTLAIALAMGSLGWGIEPKSTEPVPPNFLIILADDLGYSDLGCYGSEIATPNLDQLASNGVRFTQFYNTGRCWPTRAAMLTGYYAQQIRRDAVPGIPSGTPGTRPAWAPLLSVHLRSLGYRNYHSGKWHIDGKPLQNGFDHSFEIGGGQNNYFSVEGITIDEKQMEPDKDFYVTSAAASHAIACLEEHAKEHPNKPFFQYLAFTAPHFPLHARQADIDLYRTKYRVGWESIRQKRFEKQGMLKLLNSPLSEVERTIGPPYPFPEALTKLGPGETDRPLPWSELSEAQQEFQATKMAIHAAMIDRMDRDIGRVIDQLRKMNAFQNTVVMFLSDNGASAEIMVRGGGHDRDAKMGSAETYLCLGPGWSSVSNTPFRRHKTWNHEGGISTPLIVHWPEGLDPKQHGGRLIPTPGHVIDIAPTLWELASNHAPFPVSKNGPALPAQSLLPALEIPSKTQERELWWCHEGNRALRMGDWKIVAAGKDAPWELYDLAIDRAESKDLASIEPQRLKEMSERWTKTYEEAVRVAKQSDETIER